MTRDLVAFPQEGHMWAPQDQYSGGGQGSNIEDDRMRNIKRCRFHFFLILRVFMEGWGCGLYPQG